MLPAAQAGAPHARDAALDRSLSQGLLAGDGLLWTAPYRFHRTGEPDRPSWGSSAGTPDLGHGTAVSPPAGPSGVVAGLLPCCASPCLAAGEAGAAARTRRQPSSAPLSPADESSGCGENEATMDGARGAFMALDSGFRLRALTDRGS
jgi:hypothetical protein